MSPLPRLAALLLVLLLPALGASACIGPRQSVKDDSMYQQHLAKSAQLYWDGVRWGDHERATTFIQDSGLQVRFRYWLEDEREEYRISDVDLMQIELGPELDIPVNGHERTAKVHLRVEGYTFPAQVVKKENVTQTWYRTPTGWFVEWDPPEDDDEEHDGAEDAEDAVETE